MLLKEHLKYLIELCIAQDIKGILAFKRHTRLGGLSWCCPDSTQSSERSSAFSVFAFTMYNLQCTIHNALFKLLNVHCTQKFHTTHCSRHTTTHGNLIGTYFPLEVLIHDIDTTFSHLCILYISFSRA